MPLALQFMIVSVYSDDEEKKHLITLAPVRNAPTDVVRVRIPDLDDVGCWNSGIHFKVRTPFYR
jgi:hypothetical protein